MQVSFSDSMRSRRLSDLEREIETRLRMRLEKKLKQYVDMKYSAETMGRIKHECIRELTAEYEAELERGVS